MNHGFVRVGAASPRVSVGDCRRNADGVLELMRRAEADGVSVLVFPELCLTGYTCADLFQSHTLLRGAHDALLRVAQESEDVFSGLAVVGLPLVVDERPFNCAAVLHGGTVLGVVPKSFIPNYKEFYELRWFASGATAHADSVQIGGEPVPFGTHLLFEAADVDGLVVGVEICEDLWMPIPPSCFQALHGATLLLNLSASNEVIGKSAYRRDLVLNQSGRCIAGYVYASCGVTESTTDVVFGGHCLIAENASLLAESPRFERKETLISADVDLDRVRVDRIRTNGFGDARLVYGELAGFVRVPFELTPRPVERLRRHVDAHPFVPRQSADLADRCHEIFQTQVAGLARRLEHIGKPPVAIGVSGGLDSTLALVVACKTFDLIGADREKVHALTMPGFGTSRRTKANAAALMQTLGVSSSEVDIRPLCLAEMQALGHRPFGIDLEGLTVDTFLDRLRQVPAEKREDLVFENVQARMRTSLLMNTGFVIGTGDVSELALGWCTYNADHMSMYNPNVSIPKTLVKFLVRWVAENEYDGDARRVLLDIVATKISPELLPVDEQGDIGQFTETTIGPYELHDFFLYQFLRFGCTPEKILFLAEHAKFDRDYPRAEIKKWLKVFLKRFFTNQFKRSCLPDGPKVGSVSLSPRGDWRMPSDASAALWLGWAEGE